MGWSLYSKLDSKEIHRFLELDLEPRIAERLANKAKRLGQDQVHAISDGVLFLLLANHSALHGCSRNQWISFESNFEYTDQPLNLSKTKPPL